MSKQFYIIPKKEKSLLGIFNKANMSLGKIQEMTLKEFINYLDEDFIYPKDEEDIPEFYQEKIGNKDIDLSVPNITSRCFGFKIEDNIMEIYINTPSTTGDWKMCCSFMDKMKNELNATIFDEDENEISVNEIDYNSDIISGIKAVKGIFKEDAYGNITLESASDRYIEISEQMIDEVLNSDDMISTFDNMLEKVFHSSAYFAKQMVYKIDDKLTGVYVIGDDYDVVIPKKPSLTFENLHIKEEYGEIAQWLLYVSFSNENEESLELDYLENIIKIKDYKQLDANQIEISAKSINELKAMFG